MRGRRLVGNGAAAGVRARLAAFAVAAAVGLAGCQSPSVCAPRSACAGCGAVVVRWRLVNQSTGERNVGCSSDDPTSGRVTVDCIELVVADAAGRAVDCPSCRFPCGPLEGTTQFALPAGADGTSYQLSLRGLRCGRPVGSTPPPVVRAVRPGEVTNLGAIEILLAPDESDACDGGVGSPTCCAAP